MCRRAKNVDLELKLFLIKSQTLGNKCNWLSSNNYMPRCFPAITSESLTPTKKGHDIYDSYKCGEMLEKKID